MNSDFPTPDSRLPTPALPPARCSPCAARGRAREGERLVNGEWFCGLCFRGQGTVEEERGEKFFMRRKWALTRQRYYREHRDELVAKATVWRRKHRREIRASKRRFVERLHAIRRQAEKF